MHTLHWENENYTWLLFSFLFIETKIYILLSRRSSYSTMSPAAGNTSDITDETPGISASASSASLHHPEVRPASPSPSQRSASRVRYKILRVTSGFTHCCPLSGYNTSDQHSIKRTYFADSSSIYPGMRKKSPVPGPCRYKTRWVLTHSGFLLSVASFVVSVTTSKVRLSLLILQNSIAWRCECRCGSPTALCWSSWLTTPGSASASPSERLLGEKIEITIRPWLKYCLLQDIFCLVGRRPWWWILVENTAIEKWKVMSDLYT